MNLFQTKLENAFSDYKRDVFQNRKNSDVISFICWVKCFRVRYFISSYWGMPGPFVKKITIEAEADWLYKIGYKSREEQSAILDTYIRIQFNQPSPTISIQNSDSDCLSYDLECLSELMPKMTDLVSSSLLKNNLAVDSRLVQYCAELSAVWDRISTVVS